MKQYCLFILLAFSGFSQNNLTDIQWDKVHRSKIADGKFIAIYNFKAGVIDSLNHILIPFKYDCLEYANGILIATLNKKSGILTTQNKIITPLIYDWVLPRENNKFLVRKKDNAGLIDTSNNFIIPLTYRAVTSFLEDYFIVENADGKNGIYDFTGKLHLPEKYRFYNIDGHKIFCYKDGVPMILNFTGTSKNISIDTNIIFKEQGRHYCLGELFNQIIILNNKVGLLSSENTILIPMVYEDLISYRDGRTFIARLNGKFGIVSYKNEIRLPLQYDSYQVRKEFIVFKKAGLKDTIYQWEYIP